MMRLLREFHGRIQFGGVGDWLWFVWRNRGAWQLVVALSLVLGAYAMIVVLETMILYCAINGSWAGLPPVPFWGSFLMALVPTPVWLAFWR